MLGLDVGERRIGVAIGDLVVHVATPNSVIHRKNVTQDTEAVVKVMEEWGVKSVVIGDPLRTDGTLQDDNIARRFARHLEAKGVQVILWDERYSTRAADRMLSHLSTAEKRTGKLDAVAAQWLLQGYLDSLEGQHG